MKYTVLFVAFWGLSCAQTPVGNLPKLSPDAFEQLLKTNPNAQLVDVRTPEEYQEGHLSMAQNINVQADDFAAKMGLLDKGKPVMVYCAVGGRSASAASQLATMGFQQVYDLEGGIKAWKKAGKPVEK